MANTEKWLGLSIKEKIELVGMVTHAIQNDDESFEKITRVLNEAVRNGVFEDVEINGNKVDTVYPIWAEMMLSA